MWIALFGYLDRRRPGDGDLLIETDGNRTGDGNVRAGPRASVVVHSSYASAAQRKGRAGWW